MRLVCKLCGQKPPPKGWHGRWKYRKHARCDAARRLEGKPAETVWWEYTSAQVTLGTPTGDTITISTPFPRAVVSLQVSGKRVPASVAWSIGENLVKFAQDDVEAFSTLVMRDEKTASPWALAPFHKEWHQLAAHHDRLVLWAAVESGKSASMSICRTIWALGRNPRLRVAVVSATEKQSRKIAASIGEYITGSPNLKAVFPNLRPGGVWNSSQLTVARPGGIKDPSVQCSSIETGAIIGSRIDLMILDDVLTYENTRTQTQRDNLWEWAQQTLIGRLDEGSRVLIVGTAFHPDDLMHRFGAMPGWVAKRYPVVDATTGLSRWPEKWPQERIEQRRRDTTPLEFARQLLCQATDDATARFKREWIQVGLRRGMGRQPAYKLARLPEGYVTFTGVDLAVEKKSSSDYTVLFTILVHPDGSREVLEVMRGRWYGPEIIQKIRDVRARFFSIVQVENNAAQKYLVQFAQQTMGDIRGFTTGRNKVNPEYGVESLAAELANGKWIIPSPDGVHAATDEMEQWIREMVHYDPTAHSGDCLMASWIAREAARIGEVRSSAGQLNLTSR